MGAHADITPTVTDTIDPSGTKWIACKHHVHCMKHALHLSAKHFVKDIAPTPASILNKNAADEDEDDEMTDFKVANTGGKALVFAMQYGNLPKLCKGINRFIHFVDNSNKVSDLQDKSYGIFKLSTEEWTTLKLMDDVFQEPADAQQSFSATCKPTVCSLKFANFSDVINSGINSLCKWYHKIDETNVYFICLALDPNYKVGYVKSKWEPHEFDKGMRCLQSVFNKYHHYDSLPNAEPVVAAPSSLACQGPYGHSWMHDTIKSHVAGDTMS
ncbi:hypothetical protein BDR04DRAFT_1116063 [Suillus decipiens]|nr:hypothetical protein BDR04DRAFT_1116063 [Suillus decipiens]